MKNKLYIYSFAVLTLVYLGLTIGLPSNPETLRRYSLSPGKADFLSLTIALPLIVIWLFALYGFLHYKNYATLLRKAKEGKALRLLAAGLAVLTFALPIGAILSSLLTFWITKNPAIEPTATILRNYLSLVLPLISFFLLARGAKELTQTIQPKVNFKEPQFSRTILVIVACFLAWMVIEQPHDGSRGSYFLPNWLALSTIALPYIYLWYQGFVCVYSLLLYRRRVQGTVYINAFSYLARGLGAVVLLSVLLQFLRALTAWLTNLELKPLLAIIYLLVAFYAVGYVLIAKGARQLKKIEEV